MPLTYDDYIDESGFGRVSALESNDPTILERYLFTSLPFYFLLHIMCEFIHLFELLIDEIG